MKKSLIALAAVSSVGFAAAQSSVTVFGVVDTGFQRVSRDVNGSNSDLTASRIASGLAKTSRLGFRGVEDLGGGLKANFWLEAGISTDDGSGASTRISTTNQAPASIGGGGQGLTFNRRATVGVSGNFGEVRLGRDSVVGLLTQEAYDPFDANGVGSLRQIVYANTAGVSTSVSSVRASNMIAYYSPNVAGFTADVAFASNDSQSNAGATKKDGRLASARLNYTVGAFNAKVGGTQIDLSAGDFQEFTVGASYDLGFVKPALAFNSNRIKSATQNKTNVIIASATAPVGPGLVRAAYVRADQKSGGNNDGSQFSLGYVYNLSKRTQVYSTYAMATNKKSNATNVYAVGGAPTLAAGTSAGRKSSGLDVGLTHSF